jgi:hypothetical protein
VNGFTKALQEAPAPPGYGIHAVGVCEAGGDVLAGLRRSLALPGEAPFPPTFLKAAEGQTVAGVAAVCRAIEEFGLQGQSFHHWGIIAAPRSLGRLAAAEVLHRYAVGGALKVSPFLIPHHSLHSVSGTISQALQAQGPNFGVGGHAGAVREGLLAAVTALHQAPPAGFWLVLSECDPEPRPDEEGDSTIPVTCRALALAFPANSAGREVLRLRLVHWDAAPAAVRPAPAPTVGELIQLVARLSRPSSWSRWSYSLGWGATLELTRAAASSETLPRGDLRHVA